MKTSLKLSAAVVTTSMALASVVYASTAYAAASHVKQDAAMSTSTTMMNKNFLNGQLFGNIPNVSVRGVAAGGDPWVVDGTVKLTSTDLMASGKGLMISKTGYLSDGKPIPMAMTGTTDDVMSVGAEITFANTAPIVIKPVPLSKQGDFKIDAMVMLPKNAADPVVLIGPIVNGKMKTWFASSNFLMDYGSSSSEMMKSSSMGSSMGSSKTGSSGM